MDHLVLNMKYGTGGVLPLQQLPNRHPYYYGSLIEILSWTSEHRLMFIEFFISESQISNGLHLEKNG